MSEFKVLVHRIEIEEHPNADAIELAIVGGYRSIVQKGDFKTGDLAVYIPEQAIVPEWLIEQLGLTGRLAGKAKNRVKAIKLRGVLSQGLIVGLWGEFDRNGDIIGSNWGLIANTDKGYTRMDVAEGDDVTEFLGITKWEPRIPSSMSGQVVNAVGKTLRYDIENVKNFPDTLQDGEEVVFTEKLHGTWACFGFYMPFDPIVTSKGFSTKGQVFTLGEENAGNLYVKMYNSVGNHLVDFILQSTMGSAVYVLGEIFGRGVQDLHYGLANPQFRVFDIFIGGQNTDPINTGAYVSYDVMRDLVSEANLSYLGKTGDALGVETVPELYRGPYSMEVMEKYTDGKETVSGKSDNVREGIVMRPVVERREPELGRVILKSVSGDYLTRRGKGATEYN